MQFGNVIKCLEKVRIVAKQQDISDIANFLPQYGMKDAGSGIESCK